MTQTHKINAQTVAKPSPALRAAWRIMKARGLEMFAHEANELAAIIEDETKTDPRCVAFDKAGRALGVDAAELGESIDLAALIQAAKAVLDDLRFDELTEGQSVRAHRLDAQLAKLPKPV